MKVISKTFPGVKALDGVEIEVMEGEIHALMGENGAGKSTFMKVLNGLLQPNTGEIFFSGQKVRIEGPQQALKLGISMIHQELNPVRDMTVAENIFLGREYTRGKSFFVDKKKCELEAKNLLINFGLNIEPSLLMKELSIAQTQMIEIMKAVSYGARLIIMDEPTSSLTDDEIRILFAKISDLKKKNVAVIYISHRIDEIFEIADKVTVLRDGKYIGTKTIEEIDKNQLIHMMVGRELNSVFPKTFAEIGKPVLQVKNLSGASFKDISFEVKSGEILGFYGLVGAGRSEVFKSIFGLDPHSKGVIMLEGKQLKIRKTSDAIKAGITMVTEDRKKYGLVLCRSIKENIALPNLNEFSKGPFLNHEKEKENFISDDRKSLRRQSAESRSVQMVN
jgi:ABC-type sugar transport system ATPase subunit